MKGLLISMLVFIATTGIMSLVTGLLAKSRIKWRTECRKIESTYNNLVELHEKNMEVVNKYDEKENNINPSSDGYNSILSDFNKSNKK